MGTTIAKDDPYIYMRSTRATAVIIGSVLGIVVIKNMGYREASSNYKRMKVSLQLDLNLQGFQRDVYKLHPAEKIFVFSSFAMHPLMPPLH